MCTETRARVRKHLEDAFASCQQRLSHQLAAFLIAAAIAAQPDLPGQLLARAHEHRLGTYDEPWWRHRLRLFSVDENSCSQWMLCLRRAYDVSGPCRVTEYRRRLNADIDVLERLRSTRDIGMRYLGKPCLCHSKSPLWPWVLESASVLAPCAALLTTAHFASRYRYTTASPCRLRGTLCSPPLLYASAIPSKPR